MILTLVKEVFSNDIKMPVIYAKGRDFLLLEIQTQEWEKDANGFSCPSVAMATQNPYHPYAL